MRHGLTKFSQEDEVRGNLRLARKVAPRGERENELNIITISNQTKTTPKHNTKHSNMPSKTISMKGVKLVGKARTNDGQTASTVCYPQLNSTRTAQDFWVQCQHFLYPLEDQTRIGYWKNLMWLRHARAISTILEKNVLVAQRD
ncbi:hypothetical protein AURANDRAFT_67290 [Aureococcus anophagefferens]|uniref:Uncharacterized protein n=1 Tax=Aureococcus anophagefferens TaxID=44056 RepID=F0YKN6_AURAN|nr:hypothetical protein AURANDRAFT_67290 [Aureococcus anophagefferens]EGB04265.1 hypothetical protein AURANDRAFT_67290 [Aureococcus anophagefferens]|eukprot:XP_009040975.1 hypothetical protein AURANDRAFT_67290 [Aureococcus anophagefferens]